MEQIRIPVDRPPPSAAHREGDQVLSDVLARYRQVQRGDVPAPKLGPAMLQARHEQLFDNAVELDSSLRELAVAVLVAMAGLRLACPEIVNPGRRT